MHKVVINACYGGFGLSIKATAELFKRKHNNAPLYFYKVIKKEYFKNPYTIYKKVDIEEADTILTQDFGEEFTVRDHWSSFNETELTAQELELVNKFNDSYIWWNSVIESRHDPDLISVVEQLGTDAEGECAGLKIIEIEGSMYRIDEYDGWESVHTPESDKDLYISI